MSRIIKRTSEVTIEVSPEELATIFWFMNAEEQAKFFNHLDEITDYRLPLQLAYVIDSKILKAEGRAIMKTIGDFGYQTKEQSN